MEPIYPEALIEPDQLVLVNEDGSVNEKANVAETLESPDLYGAEEGAYGPEVSEGDTTEQSILDGEDTGPLDGSTEEAESSGSRIGSALVLDIVSAFTLLVSVL